ncbi:hypothetical protein CPB83DRAFT_853310 [Crepidotus variabilis]|uniref:Uncharacterized protein n=1 Tax=Crepidotus variabilis TaxID=179855 RepID=A0A9P6JQV9_9AGAR|nr:hypothetical protein CPB83DRAFT_853310 [Crepidotus variabilis]
MVSKSFVKTGFLAPLGLLSLFSAVQGHQYTIVNKCPSDIDVYNGNTLFTSNLSTGNNVTQDIAANSASFYTTANGGSTSGASTQAGFFDDTGAAYYYFLKESGTVNTPIEVQPSYIEKAGSGYCRINYCFDAGCPSYSSAPDEATIPNNTPWPPPLPLWECPYSDVSFIITFCPFGTF